MIKKQIMKIMILKFKMILLRNLIMISKLKMMNLQNKPIKKFQNNNKIDNFKLKVILIIIKLISTTHK